MTGSSKIVSVVTPSLNQANFAEQMLRSLEQQSHADLEHIIFDAESTDRSPQLWRDWQEKCNRTRQRMDTASLEEKPMGRIEAKVFIEPDDGQSHAINKGLRLAAGEVVGWLNADDLLMPQAIEKVGQTFSRHPDAVAVCGVGAKMDRQGNRGRMARFRPFSRRRLQKAFEVVQPAMFFKRDAYWAVGGLDESLHYAMDWDLLLKLSKIGKVVAIPDHLANIRCYEDTKTSTGGWKRMREIARIARRHNGILDRNHLSFHVRTLLAKQPLRWPRAMFDQFCWNVFKDPPLMVQGWPEEEQASVEVKSVKVKRGA